MSPLFESYFRMYFNKLGMKIEKKERERYGIQITMATTQDNNIKSPSVIAVNQPSQPVKNG